MALQYIVDSIDTVPEALRGEYTEKDGKWHLAVDGIEDTTGLKNALAAERKRAKELEKDVTGWKRLGKSAEEIDAMIAKQAADELEALKKSGNFEAILKQKEEQHQSVLKQHQDAWSVKQAEIETELSASRASERNAIIETSVMGALTKAKATGEGVDLLTERLGKRIKFEMVDGKRKIQIMKVDGETPMAGSSADGTATFDDLVKEAVTKWPSLFEGSGAGGSGKDPNNSRRDAGAKTLIRKDFDALNPAEKALKIKDGFKVID